MKTEWRAVFRDGAHASRLSLVDLIQHIQSSDEYAAIRRVYKVTELEDGTEEQEEIE